MSYSLTFWNDETRTSEVKEFATADERNAYASTLAAMDRIDLAVVDHQQCRHEEGACWFESAR